MRSRLLLVALALLAPAFAGCTTGGEGSASVYVQDAPTDEFREIHVVFQEAYVHEGGDETEDNETDDENGSENRERGGGPPGREAEFARHGSRGGQDNRFREEAGWIPLVETSEGIDVNLLNATGTRAAFLGEANLSAGTYTQIAIVVQDAYGIDDNGSRVDVTVPSGVGRVVESFEVEDGRETQIVLDLELDRAMTESGDGWKLTPVFGRTTIRTVDDADAGSEAHEPGEVAEVEG